MDQDKQDKKEVFVIEGLAGKKTLSGEIAVGGAKNAILKVIAAAPLFKDEYTLTNVPGIEDVHRAVEVLEDLGAKVEIRSPGTYFVEINGLSSSVLTPEIAKRMRASLVFTGPLLARFGQVSFPHPGGCVIGKRPIDIFLEGYEAMGATVSLVDNTYTVTAKGGKLKGAEIFFRVQSVTATETFMMAAVLAEGKTILKNCALEPETVSLGEFLVECGAKITGLGTSTIEIEGGELLSGAGKTYTTVPDRIEAGSFIVLGALCASDLKVTGCEPKHLDALLHMLKEARVNFEVGPDYVRVKNTGVEKFRAVDVKTHEYPGFPTDLQAPMGIFLTQAEGESFIFETIFEGRLGYLETFNAMGAETRLLDAHTAMVKGPTPLKDRELESPDLRAGLAYILAALVAEGTSTIHNIYFIDRGYEKIDERLEKLGAKIKRVRE